MKKVKKPMKVVMVEIIGDTGHWEWYDIIRDTTPIKALKAYARDVLDMKIKVSDIQRDGDAYYLSDDVMAYYVKI